MHEMILPGRKVVQILITNSQVPNGITVFTGAAEYPEL
jgi:hypothetical protein